MTTVRFNPGSLREINSLIDCPVLAVDLGFSKGSKSCGVAWRDNCGRPRSGSFRFGECIKEVVRRLNGHPKAVLIIEAPLSGLFTSTGNPIQRGEFESTGPDFSSGTTRYWYVGAGAAMCLAGVFFLRNLAAEFRQLPNGDQAIEIILYEGFVTFKATATAHVSDALLLIRCFLIPQARTLIQPEALSGQTLVAITDVVAGSDPSSIAPAIIVPSKTSLHQTQ